MNKVDFYRRYDDLAAKQEAYNKISSTLPIAQAEEKQSDLNHQTNELFDEYVGTHVNLLA